jgi:hypothetical protein
MGGLEEHLDAFVGSETNALVLTSPEGHPLHRTKFPSKGGNGLRRRWRHRSYLHDLRRIGCNLGRDRGSHDCGVDGSPRAFDGNHRYAVVKLPWPDPMRSVHQ